MYSEEIDVYVKNKNKNKAILYTLDGSEPKKNKFFSPSTIEYTGQRYRVKMGQTLVIKYNAFRPGFGETGVRTLEYKVRNKLNEPVIHINKNVINISSNNNNSIIKYKINNEDYKTYNKHIILENGKNYIIKAYCEEYDYVNSNIIEKNIIISNEMEKLEAPAMILERNILKFDKGDNTVFYSVNGSDYKEYKNDIVLSLGKVTLSYYAENDGYYSSDIITKEINIESIKYPFKFSESELKVLNEHKNFKVNGKSYIIEENNIFCFINDLSYKTLNLTSTIKDYKIENNKLIVLTYDKYSMIKEVNLNTLKIIKELNIDENEYDVIEINSNYYYLMNKNNIKKIFRHGKLKNISDEFFAFSDVKENEAYDYFEKTLKAKINKVYKIKVENEKIFKITGERINEYNKIEPFYAVLQNTGVLNFIGFNNHKNSNEYYITSIEDLLFSLEDRRELNIYIKGEYIDSYKFSSNVYIAGAIKDKDKIIFTGYYINNKGRNFFILTLNNKSWTLNNINESIIPNNIFQNSYYYIITGINNRYYYCEYEIIKK